MFIKFLSDLPPCESCRTLRQQLEFANHQNQQLLNTILELNSPKKEIPYEPTEAPSPIANSRFTSFHEKRKQLEAQSRIEAGKLEQLKRDNKPSSDEVEGIAELEDLIGIGGQ